MADASGARRARKSATSSPPSGMRTPASTAAAARRASPATSAARSAASERAIARLDAEATVSEPSLLHLALPAIGAGAAFALVIGLVAFLMPPFSFAGAPPPRAAGDADASLRGDIRELGRQTSQKLTELGGQVASLEAATASAQGSFEAALEKQQELLRRNAADLRADHAALSKRVAVQEERANATAEALQDRIAALEAALAEQRAALRSVTRLVAQRDAATSPDWATLGVGASIDAASTSHSLGASVTGNLLWRATRLSSYFYEWQPNVPWPADVLLEKHLLQTAGRCYRMAVPGNVTVLLPLEVRVDAVGLEHLQSLHSAPSAPRGIRVWAGSQLLADYDAAEQPTVAVQPACATSRVTFQVLSNNGDDYTCIYRLNVHGTPTDQPEPAVPHVKPGGIAE